MSVKMFDAAKILTVLTLLFLTLPGGMAQASPLPLHAQAKPATAQPGSKGAGKISDDLLAAMKSLPPGETLTVIVTLTDQVSPSQLAAIPPHVDRATRKTTVIQQLQAKSSSSQQALTMLLNQRKVAGSVSQVVSFWIFNGMMVTATPVVIQEMALLPEVKSVTLNDAVAAPPPPTAAELELMATSNLNIQNLNVPVLWDLGIAGQGIVVANLDTGVDMASHPDLAAKWRGGSNSWFDPYGQHATPADVSGHGTATMGIMVAGEHNGTAYGVAPGAQWIAAKIFNDQGMSYVGQIHQALEWVLDPDGNPATPDAPHVLNNSWVWKAGCHDEFRTAVQNIRAAGILPIFAAGNNNSTSFSPANYPESFAVGAVDNNDLIYADSSRGPSACDSTIYPEIVAPGVNIYTTDLGGLYLPYTGTSMAAPHVAGTLALLLSASPQLTVDEQQNMLLDGVVGLGVPGPDNIYGYGRLEAQESLLLLGDLDLAVTQTVNPTTLAVNQPLQFTLSVTNNGPEDASGVTLTHTISSVAAGGAAVVGTSAQIDAAALDVVIGPPSTSQGSCVLGAGAISCDLGLLPADSTAVTVRFTITPTTSGITITNKSAVSALEKDFNVINSTASSSTPVQPAAGSGGAGFKVFLPLVIK